MNFKNMAGGGQSQQQLMRQPSSVYTLTFEEFQSSLGKDFGSMNMDELLRSIWSAEETQALASATAAAGAPADPSASGLQRQGSLTLPRTLSQKTVDEVWRDLISGGGGGGANGSSAIEQPHRQPTLGEMTLEEFLFRAGVVREDVTQPPPQPHVAAVQPQRPMNTATAAGFYGELTTPNNTNLGVNFAQMAQSNGSLGQGFTTNPASNLGMPVANHSVIRNGAGMVGVADQLANSGLMPGVVGLGGGGVTVAAVGSSPANHLTVDVLGKTNGDLSNVSPVMYPFHGGLRSKRCGAGLEKVVERRQRRMIKNRESAARSRARKQAYTTELEAEVATLKQQNQELQKKQTELMEMQKNQALEKINQQYGPKRQCLRRTTTGPW